LNVAPRLAERIVPLTDKPPGGAAGKFAQERIVTAAEVIERMPDSSSARGVWQEIPARESRRTARLRSDDRRAERRNPRDQIAFDPTTYNRVRQRCRRGWLNFNES
jgi:hypothetical protein